MLQKGLFVMASLFAMMSCGQSQETSSHVSELEGNIPSFEEFLAQENSQKVELSLKKILTQEESLQKCEKAKIQKNFLIRLCENRLSFHQKCEAKCENGEWKVQVLDFNQHLEI